MRTSARTLGGLAERVTGLPLRWQIGPLVLGGLVAIFVLFGQLGSAIARDAKERTLGEWLSVTTSTAGFIDSEVEVQYGRLERMATRVAAAASDPVKQRQDLDAGLGGPGSFVVGAFLLGADGTIAWCDPPDETALAGFLSAEGRLRDAVTVARYASGVEMIGGHESFILAVPVLGPDGRRLGMLGVVGRPDQGVIQDLVAGAHGLARTGHAELVDQHDRVIASSEVGHAMGPGEHPDLYEPLLAGHRSAVGLTDPVEGTDPRDRGQRHDMAFVPLRTVPWGLAVGGSDGELSADASRWQQQITLFGGLSLVLALILVWLTTRGVARPIQALTAASRQIAAGDLGTAIPHGGEGEVRELAEAFDHMRHELQRALSALALEKSRYEGIVTSMADAVITTGPDQRITAFNPSAAALTGWSSDDAIGRLSSEVIRRHSATDEPSGLLSPHVDAEPPLGVSKEVMRKREGGPVSVSITRSAIRDDAGQVAGIVRVLRDISAEEELSRLKDEFLSTVSHELRTPLGFIMGYATTLLLPDAPADRATTRRCLEEIAAASTELKELVDNLLDMTKIGAGSLSVSPTATRLRSLVEAAVERIRPREADHRFVTHVPRSLPAVQADAHRVEQVLYNLLDNAIKYSPDGGQITLRAEVDATASLVVVTVADEGLGIAAEDLPSLFERFFRGRTARARGIGGTGLGLAICKGIVEAHGGRIWAESPPAPDRAGRARGTEIHFSLRVAAPATEPRTGHGRAVPAAAGGGA